MQYDPHEIYENVRRKKELTLHFDQNTDSDELVDYLYGITDRIACYGQIQQDGSYDLTIVHLD